MFISWLFWWSHLKVKRLPLLCNFSSGGPVCRRFSVSLASLPASAVEHPSVPESPEFVRVRSYESQMVIRPHKSFDEVSCTSSEMWWVSGLWIFSRNAFCLNWGGHAGSPAWLASDPLELWPEDLHVLSSQVRLVLLAWEPHLRTPPVEWCTWKTLETK